ncbi:hypothetical protein ATO6_20985 [Oceanicola sp. 22II-s10i]|nr:hypothetical protein ATO6_20985 [Oceanicola sp. 22II-s10i]
MPGITGSDTEPRFHAPWQARAFALVVSLHEAGAFSWTDWAAAFGARLGRDTALPSAATTEDHAAQYFTAWLATLEDFLNRDGSAPAPAVDAAAAQWQRAARATPHGTPVLYERGAAETG